jgi:hypothetical protein
LLQSFLYIPTFTQVSIILAKAIIPTPVTNLPLDTEQERILMKKLQMFLLIRLDLLLIMNKQMSGFVEPYVWGGMKICPLKK